MISTRYLYVLSAIGIEAVGISNLIASIKSKQLKQKMELNCQLSKISVQKSINPFCMNFWILAAFFFPFSNFTTNTIATRRNRLKKINNFHFEQWIINTSLIQITKTIFISDWFISRQERWTCLLIDWAIKCERVSVVRSANFN